ncbi:MAG: ChbG/HpnK family deacetylase [Clostridia bacterium]|nr:ChbG/HpnK family deacetylase [Clostridia bacterium]
MRLIVNADDFGMTDGVTQGILNAMRHGMVSSTTMMVNMPGTKNAAMEIRRDPGIAAGLHVNISIGRPLTHCPSLTRNGAFQKPGAWGGDESYDEEELYREILAQYNAFEELTGKRPTHADSHLYTHQKFPKVRSAVMRLAGEMGIPVRDGQAAGQIAAVFEGRFKLAPGETAEQLKEKCKMLLRELAAYPLAELMVHPAFADHWLMTHSSYHLQRTAEHAVLTDPEMMAYMASLGIIRATYQDVG